MAEGVYTILEAKGTYDKADWQGLYDFFQNLYNPLSLRTFTGSSTPPVTEKYTLTHWFPGKGEKGFGELMILHADEDWSDFEFTFFDKDDSNRFITVEVDSTRRTFAFTGSLDNRQKLSNAYQRIRRLLTIVEGFDPIEKPIVRESKEYDAFVSYAAEDRDSFALPLAQTLRSAGLEIWFDEFCLKVGDSLRRKIDLGLSRSNYGIVILSSHFFMKEWPKKELDALYAKEVDGKKVILPVWKDVNKDKVAAFSPTLADRYAAKASSGVERVAAELLEVIDPHNKHIRVLRRGKATRIEEKGYGATHDYHAVVTVDLYHGQALKYFSDFLLKAGLKGQLIELPFDYDQLCDANVLVIVSTGQSPTKTFNKPEISAIKQFLHNGGGLLCAGQAWSWVYKAYGNKPIETFPLNTLGKALGFWITGKPIGVPTDFGTEIMKGITEIKRTGWVPSRIELKAQGARPLIRDERSQIMAGCMSYGEGRVVVVGHEEMLEENPKLLSNIMSYLAGKSKQGKSSKPDEV